MLPEETRLVSVLIEGLRSIRQPQHVMHEFEALLSANVAAIQEQFPDVDRLAQLQDVERAFASPEEINDRPDSSPAARLEHLFPGHRKPIDGVIIAERIGLARIRERCARFDAWVTRLEALGTPPGST